jgi:energy-coupling factor transporter ATP-binding protein EcfA2
VAQWPFRHLSRGQTYKGVLAAFLVADRALWLVDEPFSSGMDPRGFECFKQYCQEAPKRGRSILFTTQLVEIADAYADRVLVLEKGKLHGDSDAS